LAKDVSEKFALPSLNKSIINKESGYIENIHYKKFIVKKVINNGTLGNKKSSDISKCLFITYKGMLKVLFSSRSGKADKFVDWATKTLFTVQMGDIDEKQELASELIGIPTKSLKQVLSTSITSVPCLYQFSLGKVKSLRKSMDIPKEIPDDYIIIKYGFTDDLSRRTKEHEKTYGKIKGVVFELMQFIYIDPKYLAQAETDMKNYFMTNEKKIAFESFKELIAINPKHEKQITKYFEMVGGRYSGCVKDLIIQNEELKHKIQLYDEKFKTIEEKHMKELAIERHQKEMAIERLKYETESLNQKLVIESLKNELLMEKLKK